MKDGGNSQRAVQKNKAAGGNSPQTGRGSWKQTGRRMRRQPPTETREILWNSLEAAHPMNPAWIQ